jgi:CelD/BcsL family acetyltransferase involved in cellulose biosynthesis
MRTTCSSVGVNRNGAMIKITDDSPTELQQDYVGRVVRIEIPLRSVVTLRRIAEELRGLATNLDYLSRRHDKPTVVLLEAYGEARRFNKRVAAIKRVGRPSKKTARQPSDYVP